MPTSGQAIDPSRSRLRLQLAVLLAAAAVALIFVAVKFQTKDFLITTPAEHRDAHGYSRLWFDPSDALVAATRQGSLLKINRWSGGDSQFDLGTPGNAIWAMPPDLSRLAWIVDSTLYCRTQPLDQRLKSTPPTAIALPPTPPVLALGVLSDGSLDVASADSSVTRFDCATGARLATSHLGATPSAQASDQAPDQASVQALDQAVAEQDYLALASNRLGMRLFRYRPGQDWMLVEESPAPEPPFRLIVPAPGVMATLTLGGLWAEGKTKNSPGAILTAVSHLDNLIVTGDFDKVLVLPRDGDRYPLADALPGSLVAASHTQIAVSGPSGTSLLNLGTESRLTATGRSLSWFATLFLAAAVLLCLGPALLAKLWELLSSWLLGRKKQRARANIPSSLAPPPPELVMAFAAGEGMLWAGSGLSAQSGLPTRSTFVTTTLQAAAIEHWIEPAPLKRLQSMQAHGESEAALNELVTAANRNDLISHFRAVYYKYSALSRSHAALTRLPLSAVITTNYDGLLDCTGEPWAANMLTPVSPVPEFPDVPFLLKLYGDLLSPQTVLLSQFEFAATASGSPISRLPRYALDSRTLLFVGCSLEGLLHDLSVIGAPQQITRKHFAAVGIANPHWEKQAQELSTLYGIEVLPCTPETIADSLPVFLESLATQVETRRNSPHPASQLVT